MVRYVLVTMNLKLPAEHEADKKTVLKNFIKAT